MNEGWKEVWRPWYPVAEGLFYVCQGFYLTGLSLYMSVFMVKFFKLPFAEIAMLNTILSLPSYLKTFPLAFCDKYPVGKWGRRRPYIAVATLVYAISFAVLSTITAFGTLWVTMIILCYVAWVIADGNLDALTVDVTPPDKAGLMQGAAWGGRAIGAALGGTVFALTSATAGWTVTVLLIGIFSAVECVSGLVMKEPKITEDRLASIDAFKQAAKRRETWLGAAYMFIIFAGMGFYGLAGSFFMMQGGIDSTTLGYVLTIQNVGAFFGSISMGRVSDKIGTKKASYAGGVLLFISAFFFLAITPGNVMMVFAVAFIVGAFMNAQVTAILRIIMELSPPEIGGSMFATYASICNAGSAVLGSLTIAYLTPILGMEVAMVSVAAYVIVGMLALPFMKLYVPENKVEGYVEAKP